MYRLVITSEVQNEIAALVTTDLDVAATANVLLQTLAEDPDVLEDLCVPLNYHYYTPSFEVKKFAEAFKAGYNIFILKFLDDDGSLPTYRILIGFHAQKRSYYALALTHRSVSYATNHDAYRNLLARYEQCGIPIYR